MYSLVKHNNGQCHIYDSNQIEHHSSYVLITSVFGAVKGHLILQHDNINILNDLRDKELHVVLEPIPRAGSSRVANVDPCGTCDYLVSQQSLDVDGKTYNTGFSPMEQLEPEWNFFIEEVVYALDSNENSNAPVTGDAQTVMDQVLNQPCQEGSGTILLDSTFSHSLNGTQSDLDYSSPIDSSYGPTVMDQVLNQPCLEGSGTILLDSTFSQFLDGTQSEPDYSTSIDSSSEQLETIPNASIAGKKKNKPCKQHACYFCGGLYTNLRKHWRKKHKDEELFKDALKEAQSTRKVQHKAFDNLRKMGDDKYMGMTNNKNIITVRNSSKVLPSSYVSCVKCKGYYVAKNYARHRREYCEKSSAEHGSLVGAARVRAKRISAEAHPLLKSDIYPYLQKESQREVLFYDPVAIVLGNVLCEEQLSKPEKADLYKYVSSQLRLLADIFNTVKRSDSRVTEIDDIFHGRSFDSVMKAIQERGNFKNGIFETPYPAMQSCTLLSKVCKRLKSMALASDNHVEFERYQRFETLISQQQNRCVTKLAAAAQVAHRRKKIETLPTTSEINQLIKLLEREFMETFAKARSHISLKSYADLAKTILANIMVINRRRPGDVHKLSLAEFNNLTRPDDSFLNQIENVAERQQAAKLCRIITKGKLNKTTANLITSDMAEAIRLLIEKRSDVKIPADNIYVFANPKAKRAPFYRADDALKTICLKGGMSYDHLRATKLRKHFATTTANMDQDTQKIISDFMGHSYNIHQNVYQIRQLQTDVCVVGRILYDSLGIYNTDTPLTTPITGNNVNEQTTCAPTWVDESDEEVDLQYSSKIFINASISSEVVGEHSEEKMLNKEQNISGEIPNITNEVCNTESSTETNITRRAKKKHMGHKFAFSIKDYKHGCFLNDKIKRDDVCRTWQTPQKQLARRLFQEDIKSLTVPSLVEIQKAIASQNETVNKTPLQIQTWIRAEIKRKKQGRDGVNTNKWTTPEKIKLRKHFCSYYKATESKGAPAYPSEEELRNAVNTIPEFSCRSTNVLKSKLQHDFKNVSYYIKQYSEMDRTVESSDNSSESMIDTDGSSGSEVLPRSKRKLHY